ncbi:efflux RND transporter permease subunit [Pantoea agglomerans]
MNAKFNLSRWALSHQQLMVFFMLLIMAAGIMSFEQLPRNEDPAFTIKTAVIGAQWPGATVTDMVNLVTDPLEQKLQEIPHLDSVESETRAGQTTLFVNLRDDTPPNAVADIWYQVRKKLQDLTPSLPDGVSTPAVNDEFDDTWGTIYGFTAEGFSPQELRDRVETVRRSLASLTDIGKIRLIGVQEQQITVAFSLHKLAGMGITADRVADALKQQNAVVSAGTLRTPSENIALRVSGAFTSEQSLRQVTLNIAGRYIPLADIASVTRDVADPPAPAFRVNGEPAIGLAISMAAGGNMPAFGKALNQRMAAIQQQLPHGIEVVRVADQSQVVVQAIGSFVRVLLEAIAIVLAVSFLSLGMRAGLVVAAAIPLVLALTFMGMQLAGIGLQRISLGALIVALGLMVDDAMIAVETMVTRLEAGDSRWRAATVAFETTAFPMLTGTLVMISGFIPVGFAASAAGEYCYSLFAVVLISLLCSWGVAILFSPLIGSWMLAESLQGHVRKEGKLIGWYRGILQRVLRHRLLTIGIALCLLGLSAWGTTFMQGEFFPASDRPELLVSLNLPANASQAETARRTRDLEARLKGNHNVDRFSSYIGGGAIRFYLPMDVLNDNENTAQLVVVAKDLAARDRLRSQLQAILSQHFSDITTRVSPLELGPPVGWPVKYRVTGPDNDTVGIFARQLAEVVGKNALTRDVNLTAGEPERVTNLLVNQTAARAAGLSSESLADGLNTWWSGKQVTTLREGNRQLGVVLRGSDSDRQDLAALSGMLFTNSRGEKIPLAQVATPQWLVDDPVIWRHQRLPFITVQTDVAPGVRAEALSDSLAPAIDRFRTSLPSGYSIEELGTVAESDKGNGSIFAVLPVTLGIMLVLLMVQLQRFSRLFLALLMAPFGLIGIVMAMLPSGTPMGFVALLGVIALTGMIIRNAVILISEVDNNIRAGMAHDAAIIAAALNRSRPIMLTACAAILGMIPISHQVFWGPMAWAITGGLLVATVVTLTVLPASMSLVMQTEVD